MTTKTLVMLSAALAVATGVAFIADPVSFVHALLGSDLSGPEVTVGRGGGLVLLSLGIACWPSGNRVRTQCLWALLGYDLFFSIYFGYLRLGKGYLLWPACILHFVLGLLLTRPAYERASASKAIKADQG